MAEKSQARANCCLTAFASEPKTVGAMVDTTISGYQLANLAYCANLCFPRAPTLPLCPQSRKRNCLRVKGGTRKAGYWPSAALAVWSCRALIGRGTPILGI